VHRRFQQWCKERRLDERESFIVAMFASTKGSGGGIGKPRRGKGVRILALQLAMDYRSQ
jgi:hypothetical protein